VRGIKGLSAEMREIAERVCRECTAEVSAALTCRRMLRASGRRPSSRPALASTVWFTIVAKLNAIRYRLGG